MCKERANQINMTLNVIHVAFEEFGDVGSVVQLFDRAQEFQNLIIFGTYGFSTCVYIYIYIYIYTIQLLCVKL